MHQLMNTKEGSFRLIKLRENALFFRTSLMQRGYIVLGDLGSPVIPMLIFNPGKLPAFSRLCLNHGLAVVVVGAPATPIISSRVRFCISASHTLQDLQKAIEVIDRIGQLLCLNLVTAVPPPPVSQLSLISFHQEEEEEEEKKKTKKQKRYSCIPLNE